MGPDSSRPRGRTRSGFETASPLAESYLEGLRQAFARHRDPDAAVAMRSYMRDQFEFVGIKAPERVQLCREVASTLGRPTQADLAVLAAALWDEPERDYQYAATWYLRRHVKVLDGDFLPTAERLITTKSWWDTVDELAQNVVGAIIQADRSLVELMDAWIESDDIWLARTALLHQNRFTSSTDVDRLWSYCLRRASDSEFFIRKAIGWALREYSKTDEAAVLAFVAEHDAELSGLSKREARKWLERRSRRGA